MTNREWLNSLNDEEFANWLCDNLYNPMEDKYYGVSHIKYSYSDSILGLKDWLKRERRETAKYEIFGS